MKSRQTTFGSISEASALLLLAATLPFLTGCGDSPAKAGLEPDNRESVSSDQTSSTSDTTLTSDTSSTSATTTNGQPAETESKPKRLARGEMPEEWIEPQRERIFAVDTSSRKLDLTFDDLKFDIEIGEPFERELLSDEVKNLDGKEITLSGYMRPSFKASGLKGFIFVRDDKECCFGPQAAIYDCVRVKLKKGSTTNYLVRPFKIRGKFYLKEREGPDGAIWSIFNMKNVKIES